jgi:S-adenosylhomocysteine hydrolase
MKNNQKYVRKRLQLLESLRDIYEAKTFQNTLLLVCHHVLESNLILLDYIVNAGINPQNVFVIGKSYSTSPKIIKQYEDLGVKVDENSLAFDSHMSFDEQFKKYVRTFLYHLDKDKIKKYDKILIMDDGGELLSQVNEFFKNDKRVVGVEQTASGYHRLSRLDLNFPIISVATSKAKLEHESPMIAEEVVKKLYKRINQMDKKVKKVLVIGNGPIGSNIATLLREDYEVVVYDKVAERTELSEVEFNKILPECDIIIGCSGQASIIETHYPYLKKDVLLVSASSSDREFESHKIRKIHEKTSNTHKDFYTGKVVLMNGGFPLNFDGDKLSVPLEKIQLTEALMFAAAIQAVQGYHNNGLLELNSKVQEKLIKNFYSENKSL